MAFLGFSYRPEKHVAKYGARFWSVGRTALVVGLFWWLATLSKNKPLSATCDNLCNGRRLRVVPGDKQAAPPSKACRFARERFGTLAEREWVVVLSARNFLPLPWLGRFVTDRIERHPASRTPGPSPPPGARLHSLPQSWFHPRASHRRRGAATSLCSRCRRGPENSCPG